MAAVNTSSDGLKICILGSGNWGCAIARIIGHKAQRHSEFHTEVKMYVYEEMVGGKKLTDIINSKHENVEYLPGKTLPENIMLCQTWKRLY